MDTLRAILNVNPNYIIITLIVLFYSLEHLLDAPFKFNKIHHHLMNNLLMWIAFLIVNFFWATVTVWSIEWLNDHRFGLLYLVELPAWIKLLLGVALFDFTTYWFHRMAHKVPLIWRFHRVHHGDTKVDASTNLRAHPVELILWFGFSNILAAGVFGLDLMSLALYFLIATPFFFLEHANLRFPVWLDKTVGLVVTTPNLHKIHHDQNQHYTDSNFSDIFILWDRLFGTFKYKPVTDIKLGLKEFEDEKHQTFFYMMRSAFINIHRTTPDELPHKTDVEESKAGDLKLMWC